MLNVFRRLARRDTIVIVATTTTPNKIKDTIAKIVLRLIGNRLYETKVIYSSINCLEISLIFLTILRNMQGS